MGVVIVKKRVFYFVKSKNLFLCEIKNWQAPRANFLAFAWASNVLGKTKVKFTQYFRKTLLHCLIMMSMDLIWGSFFVNFSFRKIA